MMELLLGTLFLLTRREVWVLLNVCVGYIRTSFENSPALLLGATAYVI
jgi:hypothetical protein